MRNYNNQIICFSLLIIVGISLASAYHYIVIHPIESTISELDIISSSSDPSVIQESLEKIKVNLVIINDKIPETIDNSGKVISKNPVWIYPTESTNFLRLEKDVKTMIDGIGTIAFISKDSPAYQTEMFNINDRVLSIKKNISDATPYMYNNPQILFSNSIWLIGIMGMTEVMIRQFSSKNS